MRDYYYERLNSDEQKYYKEIAEGLKNNIPTIKLQGLKDKETLKQCIRVVSCDFTDFFYVNFGLISSRTGPDYIEYLPDYIYSGEELENKKKDIEDAVQSIIRSMPTKRQLSVYEKCLWIHNYIVRNCTYNEEAIKEGADIKSAYSIEGVFLEKTAVCQGISLAYRHLCKRLGIDAIVTRGNSLKPGEKKYGLHAWNIVRVGDEAIHVDATWDMCMTKESDPLRYDYFFLPDIEMMRDHQYVKYPICRNRKISMFNYRGTCFSSAEELKRYIDKEEDRLKKQDFYLYFKMINKKEKSDEIASMLSSYIMSKINKSFSYSYSSNEAQSVFMFHFIYK